jgi:hypothetical protein
MKPRTAILVGTAAALALAVPLIVLMVFARMMLVPHPGNNWGLAQNRALAFPPPMLEKMPNQPAQPVAREELPQFRGEAVPTRDYRISGPHSHANLAVYFVHGPSAMKGRKVLALHHALNENLAVVHEGLSISNHSDMPLFVQGGDIVKGGNQDRVLPYDYLIPAGARNIPVTAFCVEQGRSSPRGQELSTSFAAASEQLPTRALKLAALHRKSQMDLWSGIGKTQNDLTHNLGNSVRAPLSHTSLQLTLEHPIIHQAAQEYMQSLFAKADGHDDVIGMVVAINGTVESADVYASADLFRNLWPKLARASAVAALAERHADTKRTAPDIAAVEAFLADAEEGQVHRQATTGRLHVIRHESQRTVLYEACDSGSDNLVVHRCYLAK